MEQLFNSTLNAQLTQDEHGTVRDILFLGGGLTQAAKTPIAAAAAFLKKFGRELGIKAGEIEHLSVPPEQRPVDATSEYRFLIEKPLQDTVTIGFSQTYFGLPVWEAGLSVTMKTAPCRILHLQSTMHRDISVKKPAKKTIDRFSMLDTVMLHDQLNLSASGKRGKPGAGFDDKSLKLNGTRFLVYRYDASERLSEEMNSGQDKSGFAEVHFTLPVKEPGNQIRDGGHYVVIEALFSLATASGQMLNWSALIELESESVLRLRALIDNVSGTVFASDPSTQNAAAAPSQSAATLNVYGSTVALPNLNVPSGTDPWALVGTQVKLVDFELPTIAAPTDAGGNFNYGSRTNDFAAVNAYYHCDRFFDMLAGMGFPSATYFDGTTFPVHVDHRGHYGSANGVEVNAYCAGNPSSNGIGNAAFMLADLTDTVNPLGIASDWRVVLHELGGHGILWDHVNSPNFGFAHSAGDSFAAILNDPGTAQAGTARFETFPFSFQSIGLGLRRHDRAVAAGWAWGGSNDLNGYNSEQILCTTHFRIYRSIGGDSAALAMQQFAARFTSYLILRTVGSLTPATNPGSPLAYANAMIAADLGDWTSEGHAGGAYGKVVRWAFEKQGLYQPAGAPTPVTNEGAPPAVDVYIDDGRQGEYTYQPNHWSCQNIWNRRHDDGGTTHEEPLVGATNYAYVKIKNRGSQLATNVIVKGFHANPAAGLAYPNDWQPMDTAQLAAANVPPNGVTDITVGPFNWSPIAAGEESMFMVVSATGDPSNISNITPGDSIPEWRLVPNDNNIGQRNVAPVDLFKHFNRDYYAAWLWLIGSLADGPLWAWGPHGPVPVDPWGPKYANPAMKARKAMLAAMKELEKIGQKVAALGVHGSAAAGPVADLKGLARKGKAAAKGKAKGNSAKSKARKRKG